MSNVKEVEIDESIVLDGNSTRGMTDDLKGHLLTIMTMMCKKYDCHWKDLAWSIKLNNGQPTISVKRKP